MSRSHVSPMSIFDKILQENSISLDDIEAKSDSDSKAKNEQDAKENLWSSVIIVKNKNQLILKEELSEIPISDEVEVKQEEEETQHTGKQ